MEKIITAIGKAVNQLNAEDGKLKVTAEVSVEEIQKVLSEYSFENPQPLPDLFDDVMTLMKKWNVLVPHPGYFGLFNPTTTEASILADSDTLQNHLGTRFDSLGGPYLFLDLSTVESNETNRWIFEPTSALSWGLRSINFISKEQYDAILFIKKVTPPAYLENE